jgi:ethanolamine utilization protein EutA
MHDPMDGRPHWHDAESEDRRPRVDDIHLTSAGINVGSSTAHLILLRNTLERRADGYVVAESEPLFLSDIMLTPYLPDGDIDAAALGAFIDDAFAASGIARDALDTGAIVVSGIAAQRHNAQTIGALFVRDAAKFTVISANDRLEASFAAYGSGAVALSRHGHGVLNVDVGGGTTKIAVCQDGDVIAQTAVETGARLVVTDETDQVVQLEQFGTIAAEMIGSPLTLGTHCSRRTRALLGLMMAQRIGQAVHGTGDPSWLRLPPLPEGLRFDGVVFSGGVSEYIYGLETRRFGDLGSDLAFALRDMAGAMGLEIIPRKEGIRATAIGAAQHSAQINAGRL